MMFDMDKNKEARKLQVPFKNILFAVTNSVSTLIIIYNIFNGLFTLATNELLSAIKDTLTMYR